MSPSTSIQIIDHHPLARELPSGWSFSGEVVGATSTLFVERLAEQSLALAPVEATLLTLGIYEDSGGLVYQTTTPRDPRGRPPGCWNAGPTCLSSTNSSSPSDGRPARPVSAAGGQ